MRSTPTEFLIEAKLEAYEGKGAGETRVVTRSWHRRVPRRLV